MSRTSTTSPTPDAYSIDAWLGAYSTTSEISDFTGTDLILDRDYRGNTVYRVSSYSDVGDDIARDTMGDCLIRGDSLYLPSAVSFDLDGKKLLMAGITHYTMVELNGQKVLMREDALKAYRTDNKLYDYGIMIRVGDAPRRPTTMRLDRPSIKLLYQDQKQQWHDPFVHGPNNR